MPVQLILLVSGGFGFRPPPDAKAWQLGAGPAGQFLCRCPKHAEKVVKPPSELAAVLAGGSKH
ncbi:MAG TPA: hypothetical protein VFP50_15325 [Anaeromyxobacteraceae bacterium]|nr:hypothetical protein [Anaeromyxobacteraceae bacterium]